MWHWCLGWARLWGVAADVLSRFFLDPGELPIALPRDAPWQVIGRVGDLVSAAAWVAARPVGFGSAAHAG